MVVVNLTGNDLSVLLGNGIGAFQAQQTYVTGKSRSVAIADVNGDGKPDLVVTDFYGGNVGTLLGNGNGTFQPQQTLAVSTQTLFRRGC